VEDACGIQLEQALAGARQGASWARRKAGVAGQRLLAAWCGGSGLHAAGLDVAVVPAQRLLQQVRCLAARGAQPRPARVILEQGLVVRVRALVDDELGARPGGEAAAVCEPLLGHHHRHIVLWVVRVGHHGHDGGDGAALGRGGSHEEGNEGLPRKVAAAPDAVHHAGAHHVRGVAAGAGAREGGRRGGTERDSGQCARRQKRGGVRHTARHKGNCGDGPLQQTAD